MKNQKEYNLMMRQKKALEEYVSNNAGTGTGVPIFVLPMIEVDDTDPRYEAYFIKNPSLHRHSIIQVPEFSMSEVLEEWKKQNPHAPKLTTVISLPDNGRGRNPDHDPVDFDALRESKK